MNKENENLKNLVVNRIEREHIKPKPKWYFLMLHLIFWIPGIIITILGAFAFAGIFFSLLHADWSYRPFLSPNPFHFLIMAIPLVWIICFLVFSSLIIRALRFTKKGYAYTTQKIILGSLITSISLGGMIFLIDNNVALSALRKPTEENRRNLWSSPTSGLLVGQIVEEEGKYLLEDPKGRTWQLDIDRDLLKGVETEISTGQIVRLAGINQGSSLFKVCLMVIEENPKNTENRKKGKREFYFKPVQKKEKPLFSETEQCENMLKKTMIRKMKENGASLRSI